MKRVLVGQLVLSLALLAAGCNSKDGGGTTTGGTGKGSSTTTTGGATAGTTGASGTSTGTPGATTGGGGGTTTAGTTSGGTTGGQAGVISNSLSTVAIDAPADGVLVNGETTTITVTILDGTGVPLPNATVQVTVTGTCNSLSTPALTDAQGMTTVQLSSAVAESKTVSVQASLTGGATVALDAQSTVLFVTREVSVTLTPGTGVAADGNSPVAITVTVRRGQGPGLANLDVALTASGLQNLVSAQSFTTDINGQIQAMLVSTAAESKTVTASLVATGESAQGQATFAATLVCLGSQQLATVPWPASPGASGILQLADLNGDQKLDLVDASFAGILNSRLGFGNGMFGPVTEYALSPVVTSMVATPLVTNSSTAGVVVINSNNVQVWLGNASGVLTGPANIPSVNPNIVTAIDVAEVTGDGNADIVQGDANGIVTIVAGDGSGNFPGAAVLMPAYDFGYAIQAIKLVDVNNDASNDVLVATEPNSSTFMLEVLINDGAGNLTPGPTFTLPAAALAILTGHIGQGTYTDVVVACSSNAAVPFLGNGTTLVQQTQVSADSTLQVVDVNHDNRDDIIYFPMSTTNSIPANGSSQYLSVLTSDGNGTFTASSQTFPINLGLVTPSQNAPNATNVSPRAVAGDLNGDQIVDVVVPALGAQSLQVILRDAAMWPLHDVVVPAPNNDALNPCNFTVVADFNGDARPDIWMSLATGSDTAGVFLNTGNGNFTLAPVQQQSVGVHGAAMNFNHDPFADMLLMVGNSNTVRVTTSHGDGTFANPIDSNALSQVVNLVGIDFNGDGYDDVAAVTKSANQPLNIFLNNRSGGFTGPVAVDGNAVFGDAMVVGNFTGDSHRDVAYIDATTDGLSIWAGNGDGSFMPAVAASAAMFQATTAVPTIRLLSGDLNGDQVDDIIAVNAASQFGGGSATIAAFINDGHGSFASTAIIGSFTPNSLGIGAPTVGTQSLADINLDGNLDLLVADSYNYVAVFYGVGDGTFMPGSFYGTESTAPFAVYSADFTGDGRPDLLTVNSQGAHMTPAKGCNVTRDVPVTRHGCAAVTPSDLFAACGAACAWVAWQRRRRMC